MALYKNTYRVESIRLPYWDYTTTAAYFVTICTKNKEHSLGEIRNGIFYPTLIAEEIERSWAKIPLYFPFAEIGAFIIMPNHIHGIIHISADISDGKVIRNEPIVTGSGNNEGDVTDKNAGRKFGPLQKNSLSVVINNFKGAVRKNCNEQKIPFAWQERFHEHIIRDDKSYQRIKWYIENNLSNWAADSLNPNASEKLTFPSP